MNRSVAPLINVPGPVTEVMAVAAVTLADAGKESPAMKLPPAIVSAGRITLVGSTRNWVVNVCGPAGNATIATALHVPALPTAATC